jgi:hypothetical protein
MMMVHEMVGACECALEMDKSRLLQDPALLKAEAAASAEINPSRYRAGLTADSYSDFISQYMYIHTYIYIYIYIFTYR